MRVIFTGIVKEIGRVKEIYKRGRSLAIKIAAEQVLEDVHVGDSIATNGVCLTVVSFNAKEFVLDVMPETFHRTALKLLAIGSRVNLEPALMVGDRFGGHMVTGHVDGMGKIIKLTEDEIATRVKIEASSDILRYVIEKGSIAIDGVSLTVVGVTSEYFQVSLIPVTKGDTTLSEKKIGDLVNLECDQVGKYIERFLTLEKKTEAQRKPDISLSLLERNGFV